MIFAILVVILACDLAMNQGKACVAIWNVMKLIYSKIAGK